MSAPFQAKERFDQHAIHESVASLRKRLRPKHNKPLRDVPKDIRDTIVRLRWVLRDVAKRLASADPLLTSVHHLDTVNSVLAKLSGNLDNFVADPAGQRQNIDNQTENLARHMVGFTAAGLDSESFEDFSEFLDEMEVAVEDAKQRLNELKDSAQSTNNELDGTRRELKSLKHEIETQKRRLDDFINSANSTFNEGETARAQAASDALARQREEVSTLQENAKKQNSKQLEEFKTQHQQTIQKTQDDLQNFFAQNAEVSDDVLAQIKKKLEEAEEVVGLVVDTVTTGNYIQVARRELKSARLMQSLAILFFMAGAITMVTIGFVFGLQSNGIDLWVVLVRSLVGAVLFVPAGYCAREASKHQLSERSHQRIALELTSIHPFVAPLPTEKRVAILEERVTEYFGNKLPPEFRETPNDGSKNGDVTRRLLGIVEKYAGK